jgi:hypothetical protein
VVPEENCSWGKLLGTEMNWSPSGSETENNVFGVSFESMSLFLPFCWKAVF